ncbi:stalk domain-containing protein [Aminipila sp.]|uniref:stalk domain-containing protein n=1 Tax=Aminipila sp. TaxID=2060095 RepID=UPI002898C157|nr:stalk domain-containing protein [Aminipila sp.]
MGKQFKGFILGFIFACLLVVPTTALADNIQAQFNAVNITVDGNSAVKQGENYQLTDGSTVPFSISYKGTTYIPIRKISELLGIGITYDNASKTVQVASNSNAAKAQDKPVENKTTSAAVSKETSNTNTNDSSTKEKAKTASTGYSVINQCNKAANDDGNKVQHIVGYKDGRTIDTLTSEQNIIKDWNEPKYSKEGFSNSALFKVSLDSKGIIVSAEKVDSSIEQGKVDNADKRNEVTIAGKTYNLSSKALSYRVDDNDEYRVYSGDFKIGDIIQLYETDSSNDGYDIVIFSRP